MIKKLAFAWFLVLILLFLYSFTQIDLGLTLTRVTWWQPVQKSFQLIGYFNRPLSAGLYLAILVFLFVFYFLILSQVKKNHLGADKLWLLIFLAAAVLWLSYNAFSYDLFNYIFDARIITYYGQNPYQHKALDFSGDPMLGFMHWTHRLYPYGPLWLAATVPLSFLGSQKLVPTIILFKALAVASFLVSCWSVEKILSRINPSAKWLGLAVFAFSPLVIIESLVSAHNDILMMALALIAFWFLINKKLWLAFLMLGFSVGVKFVTVLLLPLFIGVCYCQLKNRKINWEKVMLTAFFLMVVAVLAAVKRDELKPWYLLYPITFLSLIPQKKWLFWPVTAVSLGGLLHYAPFLYLGNWNPPVPTIKFWVTYGFLILGFITGGLKSLKKSEQTRKVTS